MKRGYKVKREARSKQTEPLTEVLPRLLSSMGKDKEKTYRYQLLLCHWEDVVGATVAAHVRPVRMDFRKLFLAADAPVWANELRYMERQIIDKINAFVCDELVTSIVFCAPRSEYFKSSQAEKSASSPEEVIVPIREDIEKAESAVSGVQDEELRRVAARALAQNLALRRSRIQDKWRPCPSCGKLISPEEKLCSFCRREKKEKELSALRSLLMKEPWLRIHEAKEIIGCPVETVMEARASLLRTLASKVKKGDETGKDARMLVMLFASVKPEALTEEMMKKYLDRLRFDLISDEDSEKREINRKRRIFKREA